MMDREPGFLALEYITITKDHRAELVVALGGTERAADILQRTGGFLNAPGIGRDYHRLPHSLPVEQQHLKATAASHALLAAGHNVYLDPALNALATPDGERDTALRYLAQLSERASHAESTTQIAEILTEIAGPTEGLLPLTREVVVRAWIACSQRVNTVVEDTEPVSQLANTAGTLSRAAHQILFARNHAARASQRSAPATTPLKGRAANGRSGPVDRPGGPATHQGTPHTARPAGGTRSTPHAPTDLPPPQAPPRNRSVPPLPTRLHPLRSRVRRPSRGRSRPASPSPAPHPPRPSGRIMPHPYPYADYLADNIARQLKQLTAHLFQLPADQVPQLLSRVLDLDNGILGRFTGLLDAGSYFAKDTAERGVRSPDVWLALGRAADELHDIGLDLSEHTDSLTALSTSSVAPPAIASPRVARRHR
ncbi:hypothetical protein ACFW5D_30210 [Streptomyces sp. NPDC058770]|uniref:hypothetical protein n=1 Tax=Streptomyces sp. NPDC058770 TaxID=3346631 RepID=UPI00368B6E32